jgi:hypothetical protein
VKAWSSRRIDPFLRLCRHHGAAQHSAGVGLGVIPDTLIINMLAV